MPTFSHLLIGLGNPGDDYSRTRHNIGFMALDEIASHLTATPWKKKFHSLVSSADKVLLLKPQTFMNLSGQAASEAVAFYQMKVNQLIVFHDDLDLVAGHVRIKQGGGTGGHNGLKSLDAHIGANYWRVRLGIGRPRTEQGDIVKGDAVSHYVLSPFVRTDKKWLEALLPSLAKNLPSLLKGSHADYVSTTGVA